MNYAAQQAPLQGMANQMAQYGRYGDSMLVHMNPVEVQGIAALSPTGKLTTNPVTGQPEAFLPFLAPILGSMLGSSLLTGAGAGILGTTFAGLSPAAAGAIGSGLATTAVTGDIKEGILSGITGYGLGQMLNTAAKATDPAIGATEEALKKASESVATTGADLATSQAGLEALSTAAQQPLSGVDPVAGIAEAGQKAADAQAAFQAAKGTEAALQNRLAGLEGNITGMDRFTAPFRQPGALLKGVTDPRAILPIAVGEGTRGQYRMQQQLEEDARAALEAGNQDLARALFNKASALSQVAKDYGYSQGGITSINPENYRQNVAGLQRLAGQPVMMQEGGAAPYYTFNQGGFQNASPGARQAAIRGSQVIAPPADYEAGTDPEFLYFTQPTRATPPAGGGAPGGAPGGTPGGGQLTQDIIDQYSRLATTQGNFHRQSDLSGRNIANREQYLSDFMSMRAQYPGLTALDDVLDIDPAYRAGGEYDYASIGQDTFGQVEGMGQPATGTTAAGTTRPAGSNVQQMGMEFYNNVIELNPGISPAEVGQITAQRYPGFVPPGGAATGIAALGGPDAEAMGMAAQDRMTPAMGGQIRPGSMISAPTTTTTTPATTTTTPSTFDTLMGQLQGGQYVYGDAGEAFRSGQLTQDQLNTFTDAFNQFTGTTPGSRPFSVGDVVTGSSTVTPFADLQLDIGRGTVGPGITGITPTATPATGIAGLGAGRVDDDRAMQRSRGRGMTDGRMAQRFQEGGQTEVEIDIEMEDTMEANGARLIEQTAAAIAGNMPEEQAEAIINRFIDEYGSEAFEMLRERVLQDIVPDAQTQGRIEGQGGGMDDMIPGMIGTQQPVAVSPGEYIVPADVVSGLGDGDTDAGANELDGMLDRVRQARTGRRMQPQPLDKNKVMPA